MDNENEAIVKNMNCLSRVMPLTPSSSTLDMTYPAFELIVFKFAEPFMRYMFLVLINAHSKWIDVHIMKSITTAKTFKKLNLGSYQHMENFNKQWSFIC